MSAVFYHNDAQKKAAVATRDREAQRQKAPITTALLPLGEFYLAEDYHQKHSLRQNKNLLAEFRAMYPNEKDFFNSTAAARVNGYLGGSGTLADLEREIDRYGLSAEARKALIEQVKRRR